MSGRPSLPHMGQIRHFSSGYFLTECLLEILDDEEPIVERKGRQVSVQDPGTGEEFLRAEVDSENQE